MDLATLYTVKDGATEIDTAALVAGEGIDLVVKRAGHRSVTIQLSVEAANALADFVSMAAAQSPTLKVAA